MHLVSEMLARCHTFTAGILMCQIFLCFILAKKSSLSRLKPEIILDSTLSFIPQIQATTKPHLFHLHPVHHIHIFFLLKGKTEKRHTGIYAFPMALGGRTHGKACLHRVTLKENKVRPPLYCYHPVELAGVRNAN